jgi:hypothetical protein
MADIAVPIIAALLVALGLLGRVPTSPASRRPIPYDGAAAAGPADGRRGG